MSWCLKQLWKEQRAALSLLILITLITGLLTPVIVQYERELIDALQGALSGSGWDLRLLQPALILLGCYGITYLLPCGSELLYEKLRAAGEGLLSRSSLEKLQRIEYRFLEEPDTADLLSRVAKQNERAAQAAVRSCCELLGAAISVIGFFLFVCSASWISGLAFLGLFILLLFFSNRSAKGFYHINRQFSETERRVMYLDKVVNGRSFAHEKKLFGFTDYVGRLRSDYLLGQRKAQRRFDRKFAVAFSLIDTAGYLCAIVMMALMLPSVWDQTLSIGVFIAASHAALNLNLTAQTRVLSNLDRLLELRGYWKDRRLLMELPEQSGEAAETEAHAPVSLRSIEFRNVSFRYKEEGPDVLQNVSFRLEAGKHYALVGANGSGKSTIVKLLLRLYDPSQGEILLNGQKLQSYSRQSLRGLYSAVFQDFSRYYVSLRDNITLGEPGDPARLAETLRLARADAITDKVGTDTLLGEIYEGGRNLSGGEWQRIAFARALYQGGELLLLDEPTSALDPISESEIYTQFGELSAHKTTLFITHRLASTRMADEILVLDQGRIAERGEHASLMEAAGLYARMYESQKKWYSESWEGEADETA